MTDFPAHVKLPYLERLREKAHDRIDALYWAFTRQTRAKPPCVVDPEAYARRRQLDEQIAELRRELRASAQR